MTAFWTKAVLGLTAAGTVLASAAPAEAQRYRHYRHHDDTGAAVVAGIAGIAIGAALSSDRRYDYDRRYYRDHGYYPTNGYYYRDHYPRYYRNSWRGCSVRRVYDPYLGRSVRVRYCR